MTTSSIQRHDLPASAPDDRAEPPASPIDDVEVIIVGAGFSGLGVAARLERAGIRSYRILEAADDLGGAWRDNTYPGCACDIPSPLYSYSFDQKPDWSSLFAPQPEILGYLHDVARKRGLYEHIRLGTRVQSATWDARWSRWTVRVTSGARYRARFLVLAVGPLHHPVIPELRGIETFRGPTFHSAAWRHDVDLAGRKVAVIGTGASAIQFVPAIADRVAELNVFQRTPPWILPKADRPFDARHRRLARSFPPYRWKVRQQLFWIHEKRATGFVADPAAMAGTAELARSYLERQVADPQLRARLTPDYAIGCKRLLISSDWYRTLVRPHVQVYDGGVREVLPDAVVTDDGTVVPADVLVYGTGFDAQDSVRLEVVGRGGRTLAEAWSAGKEAYLGTTVAGFPNMFLMVGPNSGLGHNSQVFMIEAQARYVLDLVRRVRRHGAAVEVRDEVQHAFNDWLNDKLTQTVWETGGCRSWYRDPRSGRNTVLWPDTTIAFWRRTRRARREDYTFTTDPTPDTQPKGSPS
jgi:cation diffusion facilitator CzcD-associated flavoprotein CzcO